MSEKERNGQARGLKPFVKGDARINRHGRPRGFDLARKLAQQIAHEEVTLSNGQKMSVVEAILRSWVLSKEPALQRAFVEIAFGKVPDTPAVNPLENKTTLILHWPHEQSELRRGLQLPDDDNGASRP